MSEPALIDGMPHVFATLVDWRREERASDQRAFEQLAAHHAVDHLRHGDALSQISALRSVPERRREDGRRGGQRFDQNGSQHPGSPGAVLTGRCGAGDAPFRRTSPGRLR